jgi:tRNA modification GTPase
MLALDDTIVAIASASGAAARGIVRASGSGVVDVLKSCFTAKDATVDRDSVGGARRFAGTIALPGLHDALAADLYLWPDRRSYTRQPLAELHTIGSPPMLDAIVSVLVAGGARVAGPGEFTLRAFLAGRLDLTQAEAVLGVIDSGDSRHLRVALEQMAGGLAVPLNALRDRLLDLLAHLEAGLDFVDEDIEFISSADLQAQLAAASDIVGELAKRMQNRRLADDQVRVVLTGAPNAGKSSLFNALLGKGQAIVSEVAGTTRDYLVGRLDLGGVVCDLIDTAGLDNDLARHAIDQHAQDAAAAQREQADVELHCIEAEDNPRKESTAYSNNLIVRTKADLIAASIGHDDAILVSAKSGHGLDALRGRLRELVLASRSQETDVVAGTAQRVGPILTRAADSLERSLAVARAGGGEELVAAELRVALDALGEVVGAVYTDDVLDRIFSRFCIGK